jgi:O-antigen/teichoic acid export membrane protein
MLTGNESVIDNQIPDQPRGIGRLFRHTAIYSISTSVQRLQGLIMTPIYTSTIYIPQLSEYSNYGLVYTFIAFMNFVYLYGMDSSFMRYFFMGEKNRKTVFSTTFSILLISNLITTSLIILFADQIAGHLLFSSQLSDLIRLAGIILFLDTLGNLPFLILRVEEKPVRFTVFRMIRFTLELLLNILFVVILRKGVFGILYANILASFINFLIMIPIALRYLSPAFDGSLLKEMVRFGLPFLPNGIAFMTIEMVDRFLVTKYLGKDVLAFYHANYKFAAVLLLIIVGFRNAWQPFFLKIARKSDAPATYSQVLNYYILTGAIIAVFITFFMRDFLTHKYFDTFYLLGIKYWPGIDIIPWIVLSYFFYGIYTVFTPAFYITKKSQYMVLFTGSGAFINILLNIILLPQIGIWGAVVATVAAYFVLMLSIYIIAQKLYPIPLQYSRIVISIFFIGLAYIIYYFTDFSIIIRVLLYLIFVFLLWKFSLSSKERNNITISLLKVFRRKKK